MSSIIYTHTDEAPLLATYSFLPIVQAYAGAAGVDVQTDPRWREWDVGEWSGRPREEIRARYDHLIQAVVDSGACPAEPTSVIDLSGGDPVVIRVGRGDLAALGLA